ncbi:MarR family winged helix-turn-helix transcriptional regulator [Nocardia transvalensis]|uniref:MarR family winged helix-turn-helix transcriptional regulator n=1 Tax=Nocardia transvalensis TaxID=37333 RepID=UPI0018942DC2|nr:MarR family transcriptional regulator [Nocardia transvalensis]MBF6327145.1 MarR family transcriptional regulator [Nocardia transvalensis]
MDSDAVIDQIAQQLIRLARIRERTQAQIAAASGSEIELAAYGIIFRLLCDGPMRSGALAEALYSDASTISRQVASLVKKGLIERRADPDDGRASVLVVTDAGRELAAEIRRRRNETLDRVMANWSRDDRELLGHLLRRFVDDYEAARPAILTPPKISATEEHS